MATITLDRRDLLAPLFPDPSIFLWVTGLAGAARDVCALTQEADNVFTLGGAMGAALSTALGMALSAPNKQIVCVTGDGELLMNVGALATVASMMPDNLSIICVDNGCHGETGGQRGHTAMRTNLAIMAEGAGIPSVMTVEADTQLSDAARFLTDSPAPRFLLARVKDGPPPEWKRNWNLAECRLRFRDAYLRQNSGG
jgi:phosphonopyruvate decarboxylase